MPGPILEKMITDRTLRLPVHVALEDFETLYTLTLRARGVEVPDNASAEQETFVLVILCRLEPPATEKFQKYRDGMCATLSNYQGIAQNDALQERFLRRLSQRVIKADTIDNVSLKSIKSIFKHA